MSSEQAIDVIRTAELDRRVAVVRSVDGVDAAGKPFRAAEEILFEVWAKYEPVTATERLSHSQRPEFNARFTLRWSPAAAGAIASDALVFEDRRFDIVGISEVGFRSFIEITATSRED